MPKSRQVPSDRAKTPTESVDARADDRERPTDILTLPDVCLILGIDRKTALAIFASGQLGRKVGKRWLCSRGGLYRWLDRAGNGNGDAPAKRDASDALLDQIEHGKTPEAKKAALREAVKRGLPISAGQK
jgi:hypothetical protein